MPIDPQDVCGNTFRQRRAHRHLHHRHAYRYGRRGAAVPTLLVCREDEDDRAVCAPVPRQHGNHALGNSFFHNEGDGNFREISDQINAENYWPWGLSVGDLNADGYEDAFLASSMNYPWRYGVNSVLLNNRGEQFLDSEFILGVEPRRDGRTSTLWFELDCDGEDQSHPG